MAPSICVPVKDLKNTSEFTDTVQSADGPVIVTKNGHEAFISMSMEVYEALRLEAARSELYEKIDRAEADMAADRYVDARELSAKLRDRYGL